MTGCTKYKRKVKFNIVACSEHSHLKMRKILFSPLTSFEILTNKLLTTCKSQKCKSSNFY